MADPISGVGSTGATTGTTSGTSAGVENPGALLDRDAFLKLLVAQLKYQDPTNPADTDQIMTQSAQLTMVDRLNEMAESFESANALSRMSLAGSMVGKNVAFLGADGQDVWARVEGASIEGDELMLVAAGQLVPIDAVRGIVEPEPAASPSTASPGAS